MDPGSGQHPGMMSGADNTNMLPDNNMMTAMNMNNFLQCNNPQCAILCRRRLRSAQKQKQLKKKTMQVTKASRRSRREKRQS